MTKTLSTAATAFVLLLSGFAVRAEELPSIPPWRTVTLGLHEDAGSYHTALRAAGMFVSEWHLPGSSILPVPAKIDLAIVSPRSLGLGACDPFGSVPLYQVFKNAKNRGLRLCPAEVGPALRLLYLDQPKEESVAIAMEPVLRHEPSGGYTRNIYVLSLIHISEPTRH